MEKSDIYLKRLAVISLVLLTVIIFISFMMGCTLSFQNISTHGTATDLVDENQSPTNDFKPKLTLPFRYGI
jgi:hypothetical protein